MSTIERDQNNGDTRTVANYEFTSDKLEEPPGALSQLCNRLMNAIHKPKAASVREDNQTASKSQLKSQLDSMLSFYDYLWDSVKTVNYLESPLEWPGLEGLYERKQVTRMLYAIYIPDKILTFNIVIVHYVKQTTEDNLPQYVYSTFPTRLLNIHTMQLVTLEDVSVQVMARVKASFREQLQSLVAMHSLPTEKKIQTAIEDVKVYSILSHRWGRGEVLFRDIAHFSKITHSKIERIKERLKTDQGYFENRPLLAELLESDVKSEKKRFFPKSKKTVHETQRNGLHLSLISSLNELIEQIKPRRQNINAGFAKLVKFCYTSLVQHKYEYAWIDTCCIDKSSSAELDESIRSMFRWYRNSGICIIHLGDTEKMTHMNHEDWFERGWTLQELLAPRCVKFYNTNWEPFTGVQQSNDKIESGDLSGSVSSDSMLKRVSYKTDIPVADLVHFEPGLQNIREKLRWASGRATTRVEDEAYCLLGVFDVTMPIAYGEGAKAFHRLQETIMQRTNDRSLFLWALDDFDGASSQSSMLASRTMCFNWPYDTIVADIASTSTPPHFTMTNTGLHIALSLYCDEFTQQWIAEQGVEKKDVNYKLGVLAYTRHEGSLQPIFILLTEHTERGTTYYKRAREQVHIEENDYFQPAMQANVVAPPPPTPQLIYIR